MKVYQRSWIVMVDQTRLKNEGRSNCECRSKHERRPTRSNVKVDYSRSECYGRSTCEGRSKWEG